MRRTYRQVSPVTPATGDVLKNGPNHDGDMIAHGPKVARLSCASDSWVVASAKASPQSEICLQLASDPLIRILPRKPFEYR